MPRDNANVYTPARNWIEDAANGVAFSPDRWQQQDQDYADALNDLPVKTIVPTFVSRSTDPTTLNPGSFSYQSGVFGMVVVVSGTKQWADVTTGTPVNLDNYYTKTQIDTTFTSYLTSSQTNTAIADAVTALKGGATSALDTFGEVETRISTIETTASNLASTVSTKAASSAVSAHVADTANPHWVTKSQVGLGNVDNTSDVNKPVSTAQASAIAARASTGANTFSGAQTAPGFNSMSSSRFEGGQSTVIGVGTPGLGGAEFQSLNSGSAAFLSFDVLGNFACYLGLDTDHFLKIGGWSFGAVSYKIHHAGIVASQAQAEAGTDNELPMTPLRTKQAVTVAQAAFANTFVGALCDDGGAILNGSGVSSVTPVSAGVYLVTLTTARPSVNYRVTLGVRALTPVVIFEQHPAYGFTRTTSQFRLQVTDLAGTAAFPYQFSFEVYGG